MKPRRAGAAESRGGGQGPRPAGARHVAQIRRALRRLSHLSSGAAQAGAARAGDAAVGDQAREPGRAKGVAELLHLAASGRTSIPVDKETPKALYRTAGYRVCGERAVRVDILERLADLIRPACRGAKARPGPKPDGVFDGRGFTGHRGDDVAHRRFGRGLRVDPALARLSHGPQAETGRRGCAGAGVASTAADGSDSRSRGDALPAADASPAPAETAPVRSAAQNDIAPAAEVPSRSLLPEPEFVAPETAPPARGAAALPPRSKMRPEAASAVPREPPQARAATAAEEPAFIEVWRPAGRSDRRPHRPRRAAAPAQNARRAGAAAAAQHAPAEWLRWRRSDAAAAAARPRSAASPERGDDRSQQRQDRASGSSDRSGKAERGERQDRGPRPPRPWEVRSIVPNASNITPNRLAVAPAAATSSRIPIRRSPSSPRSSSSLNRAPKSRS